MLMLAIIGHTWADQLLPQLLNKKLGLGANSIRVISLCSSKCFFCIGFYAYASYYRPYMGRSTPTTALNGTI